MDNFARLTGIVLFIVFIYFIWQDRSRLHAPHLDVAVRGQSGEVSGAGVGHAHLPPTYAVDLESGQVRESRKDTRDLWWEAKTRSERCLCPYLQSQALLAPLPVDFDQAGAQDLAGLDYSDKGFADTDDRPVANDRFAFAMRTVEGNFAKVRVARRYRDNSLDIEWQLFRGARAAANPSLQIHDLLEQAGAKLRAHDGVAAMASLDRVVDLTRGMQETAAVQNLLRTAQLYWSASHTPGNGAALTRAAGVLEGLAPRIMVDPAAPPEAGTELAAGISRETARDYFWWQGIVSRDGGDVAAAVPWFQRAVNIDERQGNRFNLISDLSELSMAQCRTKAVEEARDSFERMTGACRGTTHIGACMQTEFRCR